MPWSFSWEARRLMCLAASAASKAERYGRAIELDSARARRLRQELPEALYESGRSQVSLRVPKDGSERFSSVVKAADALLAVMREAA